MHFSLNGLLAFAFQDSQVSAAAGETSAKVPDAASTAVEVTDAVATSGTSMFLILLVVLAIIVLPFVIGHFIAKALRLPEFSARIGFSLLALCLGLTPFVAKMANGVPFNETIRLGIDLAGGTNMVFQVQSDGKEITNSIMDKMVGAVGKRINSSGTEEITVRAVGGNRLEVIIPGEDPQAVDEIKRKITKLGSLEFFICASRDQDREIVIEAESMGKEAKELRDVDGELIAQWSPAFEKDGKPKLQEDRDIVSREVEVLREIDGRLQKLKTEEYLLLVDPPEARVSGEYLAEAAPGFSPNGKVIVNFRFTQRGGYLFGQLTGANVPVQGRDVRKLAILLDGKLFTAPAINSRIEDRGYIEGGTGGFSQEEAKELADVLNAGALEVPIDPKPLSEATIDPTLGEDVRRKGVNSVLFGGLAVVLFMLVYYRFAGIVANLCLVLNIVLVMGTMVLINATFTLPGLAGIVLVIGMAVDANVLIYERIREELNRGSTLRLAIQNGFGKAFATIVDSNVTTLLTAAILFMIGTDAVKGFAVTLFIGIVMSMFTAIYVGRTIFDIAERRRWITKLGMMSIVKDTKVDFLGKRRICFAISAVMIVVGMLAFAARGQKNYDIDFTGGTMVAFQLTEPQKTEDVRAVLKSQFGDTITLERLALASETVEGVGRHFRLRTTESDSDATKDDARSAEERVRDKVNDAFEGSETMHLRMVTLEFSEITPVTIAAGDESAEALLLKPFEGGVQSQIKFSDAVAAGTAKDMLTASLKTIKDAEGKQKFGDPSVLFDVVGKLEEDKTAGERAVVKYTEGIVRAQAAVTADDLKTALTHMQATMAENPLFDELNTFASAVASEMLNRAILAIVISMFVICGYVWLRFQNVHFGIAGVAALVHDVVVVLGLLALFGYINGTTIGDLLLISDIRINLAMVAAFLTLVGYSLNDTIVVFDRIRELRGKNPEINIPMVNAALNQTLSRTLLTSFTTWIVVLILYVFGGEGIHGFAFCLTAGIIVGTYSSIYVASPILIWLMNRKGSETAAISNGSKA
ncbi:MAG: protein translocase subunit SecD [Planctomyces sp.]|nr:protein translocase subunit SecD [Planctomyces sp.]